MVDHWALYLTGATAFYCWLVSGVFLTFSDFVMKSLGAIPAAQGIAAMQSINIKVFRSLFMVGLFSIAAVSVYFIAAAVLYGGEGSILRAIAGGLYLVTVMLVSVFGNIPLNNKLAVVDPETQAAAELWHRYLKVWVQWNHIRTLGSAVAALLLTVAAFQ